MIWSKCGEEEGGWWSCEVRYGYGVGFWKSIMKEQSTLLGNFFFFFVVGNGRRVKLWMDKWCGDELLCASFLSLFALAVSKDAWVVVDVWV